MKSRAERIREFTGELNPVAWAVLVFGMVSVLVAVLVSSAHFWIEGLTPVAELMETATSSRHRSIFYLASALGLVAVVAGFLTYKRMPTKPAREATVSGAALGAQALLLSAVYLVFSSGEKFPIFVRQFFNFEAVAPFIGQFFNAAKNTLILAFLGQGLGMVLGLFLAVLVLSNRVVVRAPARLYINAVRGTPLIVQLAIAFFGVVIGIGLEVSAFSVAGVVLGLNAGAYTAEIFRAGIQSLERGQMEASRSLGMSYGQAMTYVIVPQAIRRVIPPLMNEFVILLKDTSLVFVLGLTFSQRELLSVGRDAYAEIFNATPYLVSAAGYLIVTLPLIRLVTMLERKLRSGLVGIGA